MTWPFRPYPWPIRSADFWDAATVMAEAPSVAEQVVDGADGVWPFGDADVAEEANVLDDLAALTSVHGPWEAANNLFNPINEGGR
ncbi:hypothetical protein [Nonomuraea sp. NPDC049028]|uniref:hypothetical protein n=1 Tax=Nonomuraea sp. NPDC049028 TaxID=3364348 RepID=UPI00371931F7